MGYDRVIIFVLLTVICGCAGRGPRSTRLTAGDLVEMSDQFSQRLGESDWMRARDGDSPRAIIAASRVENLSSDLIPKGEQWFVVTRTVGGADLVRVGKEKSFAFVIPAEHLREGLANMTLEEETARGRTPTHEMSATIRSATRSARGARTDLYLVEYRVTRLGTGELEWSDTFEFKRAAVGKSFD